jgi:two-component system response regulator ResD
MAIKYPIKILYIEDDKLFRDLIKMILKDSSKYFVDVAEDGNTGVKMNLNNVYDIILMDIMMPKMDGVEAAYNIKMTSPKVPIMAVTALEKYEIRNVDDEHFPIDYYLRKPIYSNILIEKIENILNK